MFAKLNEINNLVSSLKASPELQADFLDAARTQFAALAKILKEDEDLAVYASAGADRLRVFDIETASATLVVLHGIDAEGARTSALVHPDALNFLCKVVKLKPGTKRRPVGFHRTAGTEARP
jgi:hypothetical protein